MLIEHQGRRPVVPASAYVAPTAVLCGAVTLGENAQVLHGAVLSAEDGEVTLGSDVVVMENALVRGPRGHWVAVGVPARIFSPDRHSDIWEIQQQMDFPGVVYGVPRGATMREIMAGQVAFYGEHINDRVVEVPGP
ncbi:hypothetical protein AB0L06_27065 [Spirillospora sp. NPDC052269]